jgi:AcrR family transcriptional regulator
MDVNVPSSVSVVNIPVNRYDHRIMTRKYQLKRRAEQQARTRDRIVEAVMALHEELGPRNTTITAVAERAGVQRLTVYRHFPDEHALFQACTSRWLECNPPPAPQDWDGIAAPEARARAALGAVYAYYRRTEPMWSVSFRDESEVEALQGPMAAFREHLVLLRDDLLGAWRVDRARRRRLAISISHALEFATWRSLKDQGLRDGDIADLVVGWLRSAAGGPLPERS